MTANTTCKLTKRETEILFLLSSGLTHKKMSDRLQISKRTVDTHVSNIMKKLGVHYKAGLIRYAVIHKIA